MDDEISILIRWELKELEEQLKKLKSELDTLMIHRNTAALRIIALQKAGLPYPADVDDLESLDRMVEEKVTRVKSTRHQISAWQSLLQDLANPQVQLEIKPIIRTIEL